MDEATVEKSSVNAVDLIEAVTKEFGGRHSTTRYSVDTFIQILQEQAAKLLSKKEQDRLRKARALI